MPNLIAGQKVILSLVITLLFILISYFEKKIKNKNEYYNREIIISGVINSIHFKQWSQVNFDPHGEPSISMYIFSWKFYGNS